MTKAIGTAFAFLLLQAIAGAPFAVAGDLDVMHFRETETNTQHLYSASCFKSKNGPICTMKVMSISNAKAPAKCSIRFNELFTYEPAVNPQPKNYTVSLTAGLCGYTNRQNSYLR